MTLYLKYRPQTIEELDLESVREQLKKIVASGSLPHAFLLSGPKGIGKTSAARIMAKIINCENPKGGEPCNKCKSCQEIAKGTSLDVIEIDAASNRGIDDIRSLKENIMLAPSSSPKKIYIVDEAHMLTLEAANAFLKTLEEPPEHVVFILATTDPQKLPETVRSRLIPVNFKKASDSEIERQIKRVAEGEKINIDKEAIKKISKIADGSFRDAVKALEQLVVSEGKKITSESVDKFAVNGNLHKMEDFMVIIEKKDPAEILSFISKLVSDGVSLRNVVDSLIEKTREKILEKESIHLIELLIEAKSRMKDAFIPELPLEIALVKYCSNSGVRDNQPEDGELKENPAKGSGNPASKPEVKISISAGEKVNDDVWKRILMVAKGKNTTIEALLRAAEPLGYDGHSLTLGVYYKFHKEKLEAMANKKTLEDVVAEIFGNPVEVVYTLTERKHEAPSEPVLTDTRELTANRDKDIISAAKEIFGQ